ncbi:glycerate kinase type-2 family protein [Allosediminivita pacifica]|uniref:Hydroxypyruvate reductase n=1 Tax=Allosediminivita pacifica TaxID=1267769 RepID=A0A2T6A1F0_9RHOB|nr:glycerate kinase [Allosediminivita pacifica]PTX37635.1 hydroxypyruvate reductase [Allosediminivita pacifica]GGB09214.1 hydroxypyruvate reductase [Allosediminivita pacifica]
MSGDIQIAAKLRAYFDIAVAAADPMRCVPAALPPRPKGRVVIVGAGKASARMAEAVESAWGPCEGLVITRYGYGRPCAGIEIVEAAHPVPDAAGAAATARMLELLQGLGEGDLVVALISGGASALLVSPAGDITLEEKQAVNAALLASGAPITQMNTVRKHLSRVKGGQLAAAAYPAKMASLVISDVAGDDPAFIASGPTVGDASTPDDARAILTRWGIEIPASVDAVLNGPRAVLSPGDDRLSTCSTEVIAAPSQSLEAAAEAARAQGFEVEILGDAIEGEAREVAAEQAELALARQAGRKPSDPPLLLLSGGECTVTRRGDGIGGPNAEYALALAVALKGAPGIHAIAGDTDGVDGAAEVAGALVSPETLEKARAAGISPEDALAVNDAHGFFAAIGDQVVTGPTLTNVNDFRAVLIEPV